MHPAKKRRQECIGKPAKPPCSLKKSARTRGHTSLSVRLRDPYGQHTLPLVNPRFAPPQALFYLCPKALVSAALSPRQRKRQPLKRKQITVIDGLLLLITG